MSAKNDFCDRINEQYLSRSRLTTCNSRSPSAVQPKQQVAQMNNISMLSYQGNQISQRVSDSYVNATQMCKPFAKRCDDWLKTDSAKAYIEGVSRITNIPVIDLVQIKKGSPEFGGGTWIHSRLAIEFSRWLSVDFAIWCDEHIKTLIETGTTSIEPVNPLDALIAGLQELKAVQERQNWLEAKTKELEGFVHQHEGEIARIFSPYGNYYSVMGYANLKGKKISFAEAVRIGKLCAKASRELGISIDELQDPRFGRVNSYAEVVLQKYFD